MDIETERDSSTSSVRTTKRKLEDAIRTLDGIQIVPPSLVTATERPTPSKRPHISRSVYSTLSTFGAKSKGLSLLPSSKLALDVSKSAPRLAAILARSTLQPRQLFPLSHVSTPSAHSASEYRPSSVDSFLSRLATYKITTYANKPPQIDAVAAARCGWVNDGKDRLVCGMCDVSWALAGREGMKKDAANTLIEKQRVSLVEMHKDGCPWKARQCEPSIYRVPLQPPATMVCELRTIALSLEPLLSNVAIRHPLTSLELSSLRFIFAAESEKQSSERFAMGIEETTLVCPSDNAIVVALFGWVSVPAAARSELRHASSLSLPRLGTYGTSASRPPTPSLSRANSVSAHLRERANTPAPTSPRMSISQLQVSPDCVGISSCMKSSWPENITTVNDSPDVPLVRCILCHRRIGLWGYSRNSAAMPLAEDEGVPSAFREHHRELDLVKEHRSYCPYIVCSSVVPSFPHSPPVDSDGSAVEGWRAVLAVVKRYELSQRQRLSRFLPSGEADSQASSTVLKGVEAMVAGVKTNGGGELLRYVKGLLG